MAKNLRAKLPINDTLVIQDVNLEATKKFLQENPEGVGIADSARDVGEKAVCLQSYLFFLPVLS